MAEEEKVLLFRTWSSPFALRAIWALEIKGIPFETTLEVFPNKSPQLLQYNPVYKKVPVLVHNGKPISESLVILEYIEDTWKQNPLLPEDPYERSVARFWAKFGDDKVLSSIWSVFSKQGKEQEEAMILAKENLKYLEEELTKKNKRFFGGDTIGLLDLALGWLANLLSVLEEIIGLKIIDDEAFPSLSAWMQDFSDVPVIKENWPPRDKLLIKFLARREPFLAAAAAAAAATP